MQICRALLESNNWDLEATAREQFDPQDSRESTQEQRLAPHDEAPEASAYQNNLQSPRIIPERNLDDGIYQENNLSPHGSHSPSNSQNEDAFRTSNRRSIFPVQRDTNVGVFGILRWGLYLITLPIAWPVRIAYNTVTNIFGFVADLLGFGYLFGPIRQGTQRGRRFLPRPPATDPKGSAIYFHIL